jgi:hypothetical protein
MDQYTKILKGVSKEEVMANVEKEIRALLSDLKGLKDRNNPEARAIRRKLRELGYSLREGGMDTGKKKAKIEDKVPSKKSKKGEDKKSKKKSRKEVDEDEEEEETDDEDEDEKDED